MMTFLKTFFKNILRLLRFYKNQMKPVYMVPDFFLIIASLYLSLSIRVSPSEYPNYFQTLTKYLPIFVVIKFFVFFSVRLYDILWRYVSARDSVVIFKAVIFSSLGMLAATYLFDLGRIPRSLYFIDAAVMTLFLMGSRLAWRMLVERTSIKEIEKTGKITLIYGAGENGRTMANRLLTDSSIGMKLVGFVDDDAKKIGMNVGGVKVLGDINSLSDIIIKYRVQELLVAIKGAEGELLTKILSATRPHGIKPKIMSSMSNAQDASLRVMRTVQLSDLLKRSPRVLNTSIIGELVKGKTVLVTGAGGSIGSELSRQIYANNPAKLILLDHSEYNLYLIDKELREASTQGSNVIPVLADLKDKSLIQGVFKKNPPTVVFHAAAYKHVHLVELNPHSAILNNILALRELLDLSLKNNVQNFVLISTDKAVNPVGVMGLTKRVCELMVAEAGKTSQKNYCSVRFGNVLGSSGSLIPLLKEQIERGEPITLTHPDMNRYFMLISEAVSLVLRAATMAEPGDIAILRMGDPIKIVDIARSLLALMGLDEIQNPIMFTGARPGEKMYEELYLCGDELQTTEPDILIAKRGDGAQVENLKSKLEDLIRAAQNSDSNAIDLIKTLTAN